MAEKSGRQTDRQIHRCMYKDTDGANHSIVAHFVRGNYNDGMDGMDNDTHLKE